MSAGQVDAPYYPLAQVWSEADIVRRQIGARIATETDGIYAAIASSISGKSKYLKDTLKRIRSGKQ